jgi:triosephosphate isomerase
MTLAPGRSIAPTTVVRRSLIGTSWKMNLTPSGARDYLARLRPLVADVVDRDLFVLPSFAALWVAREQLQGSRIAWGAQDVHPDDWGAHTGDVSAPMLADLGCRYVEVGHHERERDHGETLDLVRRKVAAIVRWGMTPIVCVGERARVEPDAALQQVGGRLERALAELTPAAVADLVIAYEPIWAIGDGADPAPAPLIGAMLRGIGDWLSGAGYDRDRVRVIYGGSIDAAVAGAILGEPGVDGLFVGRYGLDPAVFARIARTPLEPADTPP